MYKKAREIDNRTSLTEFRNTVTLLLKKKTSFELNLTDLPYNIDSTDSHP